MCPPAIGAARNSARETRFTSGAPACASTGSLNFPSSAGNFRRESRSKDWRQEMRLLAAVLLIAGPLFAQDPVDSRGWINRGVIEFKAGHYPEAASAFQRAVDS